MSSLSSANIFGKLINGLSDNQKQHRKFLYLEGLIRFLELYGQNEIGNVELDYEKISLYINSASFENMDLRAVTSIDKVFKMLEEDLYNNIPLYRFFKLSDYQLQIFEKDHYQRLLARYLEDAEKCPCLKCIWYHSDIEDLGWTSVCSFPIEKVTNKWEMHRRGYLDISKIHNCEYCTPVDSDIFIKKYLPKARNTYENNYLLEQHNSNREKLIDKIKHLDNSAIPPYVPEEDKVDLSYENNMDNAIRDFGRAYNNKLTLSDIRENHVKAIFLEGMIKFIELYAQNELNSNYIANITNIAKYVFSHKLQFKSIDEVYQYLENMILSGESIKKFIKIKLT